MYTIRDIARNNKHRLSISWLEGKRIFHGKSRYYSRFYKLLQKALKIPYQRYPYPHKMYFDYVPTATLGKKDIDYGHPDKNKTVTITIKKEHFHVRSN